MSFNDKLRDYQNTSKKPAAKAAVTNVRESRSRRRQQESEEEGEEELDERDTQWLRGRLQERNATASRESRERSRNRPQESEFTKHMKEQIETLEKMTSHLHQPKTGIEESESKMKTDKTDKSFTPPPLIVTEFTSESKEQMLNIKKMVSKSLKNLRDKQKLIKLMNTFR
jgi:hypothetical protein